MRATIWPHSRPKRSGAISPFIWWHNEVFSDCEEVWSDHRELRGRAAMLLFRFWLFFSANKHDLYKSRGGVRMLPASALTTVTTPSSASMVTFAGTRPARPE
jgi:hypothetical protein